MVNYRHLHFTLYKIGVFCMKSNRLKGLEREFSRYTQLLFFFGVKEKLQ